MYLQSLEIVGFKSFAPKTILEFHRGVTAIVGPNGCGKSNVLDAMRWVLGEQSAKALRGGEMADVIFSGTDSRPALGMAEVSLTFADCEKDLGVEWNEVRITRRVFRDGKSEYLLNKAPCRLRDIHQLFMDTGIGRSAYSIMEQGKIDAILSSRPEDRRAIFEEAAGITKYKAQKKEALRKLEYTETNLVRVEDIIKEVKRQIGSLQRQAAKARRYQACMADLKTFDLHLSHRNYQALASELESVQAELNGSEDTRALHEREIEQQEVELMGFRARVAELDAQMNSAREQMQEQRNRIYSARSRIETNGERADEARSMIGRTSADIAAAEEKILEQESEIESTNRQIEQMIELLRSGESELDTQQALVNEARELRAASEREVRELANQMSACEGRMVSLRGELASVQGRNEAGEGRLQTLRVEAAEFEARTSEIEARVEQTLARVSQAAALLEQAQNELLEAERRSEEASRSRQELETQNANVVRNLAERQSRYDVLRQLSAEGEGFGEGTQAVLRGLDNPDFFKAATQGVLADFVEVDGPFIPAIESVLGNNLQTILFKEPELAQAAINTLNHGKLGKATLVPAGWLPEAEAFVTDSSPIPEGALTWARACVRCQGAAAGLIQKLLQDVVVVQTLEEAVTAKARYPRLAFVTLEGDFINVDGLILGGRSGEGATSALARKSQIASLESELQVLQASASEVAAKRDQAVEALANWQTRLKECRDFLQEAQSEVAASRNEQAMVEREKQDAQNRYDSLIREADQLDSQLSQSRESIAGIELQISETGAALDTLRIRQEEARLRVDDSLAREQAAIDLLNELRVRVATERQQHEALSRQRGPMESRLAELSGLLEQRRADIIQYEERISRFEAEVADLTAGIENWTLLLQTAEEQIHALQAQRSEAQESVEALETTLRVARKGLADLQEQRGRLEVRVTQIQLRVENITQHVSRRYQTDLEAFEPDTYAMICALRERDKNQKSGATEAEDAPVEQPSSGENVGWATNEETSSAYPAAGAGGEGGIPWERIEALVSELSDRLDSMGPVNLDAIQEYDELEQRYTFLEQQHTDLINSKTELLEVIAKINTTTQELFADTFIKIRDNFQVMFTELFGGGKASLLLADEKDPLECGIEIIAKPPGKQLQSITLLSGGEKTMTAVSLLFAIYMVKPSPFCVLDEMDAPLDESNISRFIKILDRFVDQSQFVVITHNKRTIARADMLYGVTMEEHGVSKLVSMKFRDRKEASDPAGAAQAENVPSVAESLGKTGNLHSEEQLVGAG